MAEVTATAPVAPSAPTPAAEAAPDLGNMTGEQAVAYVEAQKAKESGKLKGTPTKPLIASDTVKDAAQEAMRKYKVKVDGQELEVDENELLRGYSHQRAANKILQEGKLARKQAEEFIAMMRDPDKVDEVLKKLGHEPRTLYEKKLVAQLEDEMMDPRDKELKLTKAKLKQIEDMEAQQKAQLEDQRVQVLKDKFAKDYTEQFTQALTETNIPATKGTVAEMAKYIARSAQIGFKMTAQEAAQLVREDIILAQQRLIGDSDGETLIKLLGEDVANKVRKWDTSRLKNPEPARTTPLEQGPPRERKTPHKRMSPSEWREFNRKR